MFAFYCFCVSIVCALFVCFRCWSCFVFSFLCFVSIFLCFLRPYFFVGCARPHVYAVLSLEEYAYEFIFTSVVCRRMHLSALSGQPFLLGCALILRVTYAVCIFFSIMDLSFVAECCISSLSVSRKRILSIAKVFVSSNSFHCRLFGSVSIP